MKKKELDAKRWDEFLLRFDQDRVERGKFLKKISIRRVLNEWA